MGSSGVILLVDSDPVTLAMLEGTFSGQYRIEMATSGEAAIELVEGPTEIDAVVIDLRNNMNDSSEVAAQLKASGCETPIIFHTWCESSYRENGACPQTRSYSSEMLDRPNCRLKVAVSKAVNYHQLETHSDELIRYARSNYGMVGSSLVMQKIYRTIEKVGCSDGKVMILGPTGTGKELVARALHARSTRADKRIAVFNCNHKSPDLVESELFGHIQGAFTGAVANRIGMFEYADSGTLFLDEVGNLDFTTQAKLLRVLETGEIQRIGLPETITVDVRILCATHHDLEQMVRDGSFRDDLYYRLKGVTVTMPPLCSRREDIPELIDYFAEKHCKKSGIDLKIFSPNARELLIEYDWPGNVRQLGDTVQSLIDVISSYYISGEDVSQFLGFEGISHSQTLGLSSQLHFYKRLLIIKALDQNDHNVAAAARSLSLDPSNLRKIITGLDLNGGI